MDFLTKLQAIVSAIAALSTAVGQLPAITTALTNFNTFLDSL